MNAAMLEHPLVRDYLRRLDAACALLPAAQARELRDQITTHIEEALAPDAADREVRAVLDRLGAPAALAAEVGGPVRPSAGARLRIRLARVRWWAWTATAVVFVVIAAAATYLIAAATAGPLSQDGLSAWWFPQDRARSVQTRAGDVTQFTVPERWGQRQGFVVGIYNDTGWTQTITGLDQSQEIPALPMTLAGAAFDGTWTSRTHWELPVSVPPHSSVNIRVLWTSRDCEPPGAAIIIQDVVLRVRVGVLTRTEDVPLNFAWGLSGTKASTCR